MGQPRFSMERTSRVLFMGEADTHRGCRRCRSLVASVSGEQSNWDARWEREKTDHGWIGRVSNVETRIDTLRQ